MQSTIAIFGEAETGRFHNPYDINSVEELYDKLGNPTEKSFGIFFAIKSLFYNKKVIFFRVEDEGFGTKDYILGLDHLKNSNNLEAIGIPGVGNLEIIQKTTLICNSHNCIMLFDEKDLFDYLTS